MAVVFIFYVAISVLATVFVTLLDPKLLFIEKTRICTRKHVDLINILNYTALNQRAVFLSGSR